MVSPLFIVDSVISATLLGLGFLVLLRNNKLFLNRVFTAFTTFLALWIISNFFSNELSLSHQKLLIFNHLVLFFPGLTMATLLIFVGSLTGSSFYRKYGKVLVSVSMLTFLLTLTPLVVQSIEKQKSVVAIHFGPLSLLYFLVLFMNMGLSLLILLIARRKKRGNERRNISTILWGLVLALGINFVTNAIVPYLGGSFVLTNFGPLAVVIIVVALLYSITKHRLFDIKAVIARSLAYVLSIVALGLLYGAVAFLLIGNLIYGSTALSLQQQVTFAMLAALITFVFQPVRHFFDIVTRRFFYKDGYVSQDLFNELNKVLVAEVELESLLNGTLLVIEKYLKTKFGMVVLMPKDGEPRIVSTDGHDINPKDMQAAHTRHLVQRAYEPVIITDFLGSEDTALKKVLMKNDIALLARLRDQKGEVIGHIGLGPKKSGNIYSKQDVQVIDAIANELVIATQNALRFEQIENFNLKLRAEVERATLQLRRTNDKLRKMDQTKDDFISMASHQLRTPLTSVKGYVSMVLDGDVGDLNRKQRDYLNQVFVSSQRMSYLISDLLNVSRLRTGKFIIDRNPCNLANVIHEEVSQLIETAKARDLKLIYHSPERFPSLMLDEMKMRQVIMNFIDNAIYYTPGGGSITVTLADNPQSIEFTVTDTGIGVPRSEQHHLFSKFFRAQNARVARPDGTGLGLFMAKKVVTAQGGAIIFKSREGKGSTFGFTMPKTVVGMNDTGPKKVILHS